MQLKALLYLTFVLTCCKLARTEPKRPVLIEEKVRLLQNMAKSNPIIYLNMGKFKEYVISPPRLYSFVVFFTVTTPERHCDLCLRVHDRFWTVGNSFRYAATYYSDKLFFGIVDFEHGSDIFEMLHLTKAPVIMHFPAKGSPMRSDIMDLESTDVQAEDIAIWIQAKTGIIVRILHPPNYFFGLFFILVLSICAGYLYFNHLEFLYNKKMWASLAVGFCFTMVSGHMWNQITAPLFYGRSKDGFGLIYTHHTGQYVVESCFVAIFNAAVVIGMVMIIDVAATNQGRHKKYMQCIPGLLLVCIFFSLLLCLLRTKMDEYPYSSRHVKMPLSAECAGIKPAANLHDGIYTGLHLDLFTMKDGYTIDVGDHTVHWARDPFCSCFKDSSISLREDKMERTSAEQYLLGT